MFQLTYKLKDVDAFTHQISQLGAQFLSKGPVQETYFALENDKQLRLDQGMTADLILITKLDHYQVLIDASIAQHQQLHEVLTKGLGQLGHFAKQVIRYHFKKVLLEIHRYEKFGDLLILQAEDLQLLKSIARQLSLEDSERITSTSLDL
jgi:hypothetical protein